ncbi:hypothetical protein GCM10011586_22350 [Silvibacterium dinghuense]|nr:hypothetical protein GCM10011586_22350 [Silvibacterium dinghuense]
MIGIEVFRRSSDYDTATDPIVRVTAGEIRKRLAQYYQEPDHHRELRIELPLGSYMPVFMEPAASTGEEHDGGESETSHRYVLPSDDPALLMPAESKQKNGSTAHALSDISDSIMLRKHHFLPLLSIGGTIFLLLSVAFVIFSHAYIRKPQEDTGLAYVWNPFWNTDSSTLIVLGTHSLDKDGHDLSPGEIPEMGKDTTMLSSMIRSDMVPISDLVSVETLVRPLADHRRKYSVRAAHETTFEQIQQGPVLLIGAFDNPWTLRLTENLPYVFRAGKNGVNWIVDRQRPQNQWGFDWSFDSAQQARGSSRDYAIVAGFFDADIQQHVLVAAGIGKSGTAAAAEFLSTNGYLKSWLAHAPAQKNNFEIVLTTETMDAQQGPPRVVQMQTW